MTIRSLPSTLISCYELVTFIKLFCDYEEIQLPFTVDEIQINLAAHITDHLSQEHWLLDPEDRTLINFYKKIID